MLKKYIIIRSLTLEQLEESINAKLNEGYKLAGNAMRGADEHHERFYIQPMILEKYK